MSIITDIKRRILELSPASFQEFCDVFLSKKGYKNLHGYGMEAGSEKTTIGNPDSYFRLDNGKYVLVAYTTQKQNTFEKIKEDIEKCLDPSKTEIETAEIEEIICCHTSSNISAGEDKRLHDLCASKGIHLTIYGIDEIATQVFSKYRSLSTYLGLSIDTHQFFLIDDFIEYCDSNGMTAPLNTTFQFRTQEKEDLTKALSDTSIVVVTGKAGVGKTRLVLEAVRDYSINYGYMLWCVKNNNLGLYEDLISVTEQPDKYLFFIDDANELAGLKQILAYTTKENLGYTVKVIVTVRDYAKAGVISDVMQYAKPTIVEVKPFTDDEIKGFLDKMFGIKNSDYINRIIAISEGNPRIAYMAGKLAVEESLSSINDVSQLYEAYYKSRVDDAFGDDRDLCFTAGVLAVINAVVLDNLMVVEDLLRKYDIDDEEFKNKIFQLAKLEVVEIHLDKVAALSDQCLANYMLYYVFFQKKIIPLGEVLEIGYKHFRNGVLRSVNTILNIFQSMETRDYCEQEILRTWSNLEHNRDRSYEQFVEDFHVFNPEAGFLLAKEKIDSIKQDEFEIDGVDFKNNMQNVETGPLRMLEGYNGSHYIDYVIELLLGYCEKTANMLVAGSNWLEHNYGINTDSYKWRYSTQIRIGELLYGAIELGNPIAMAVGLQWAQYALDFRFRTTALGRKNTFLIYHLDVTSSEGVNEYRKYCWKILSLLAKQPNWHDKVLLFFENYTRNICGCIDPEILRNEKQYVEDFLYEIECDNVRFLKGLERLLQNAKTLEIEYDEKWQDALKGNKWTLYKMFEDDYSSTGISYDEYNKLREKRIKEFAEELTKKEVFTFVQNLNEIMYDLPENHDYYMINHGMELLLHHLNDEELEAFLSAYMIVGTKLSIRPLTVMERINNIDKAGSLLEKLKKGCFPQQNEWLFAFFDSLPDEAINEHFLEEFLMFLNSDTDRTITSSPYRRLKLLDKFIKIEPNIYPIACSIIYKKREYNSFIVEMYFSLLFHEKVYSPQELLELFKENIELLQTIYFYSLSFNHLEDYTGAFLKTFIALDASWLQKYSEVFWDNASNNHYNSENRTAALWKTDRFIEFFDYLFYHFPEDKLYNWILSNTFGDLLRGSNGDEFVKERQKEWLTHLIIENAHSDSIKTVFDVVVELEADDRRYAFKVFLENNDNYEAFEMIKLLPDTWSGTDSFIPAYQKEIEFLESLYPYVSGVNYLKHQLRIKELVGRLRDQIKREEIEVLCRHLYM